MYRHILIATDGSLLAEKAVLAGLTLAKDVGAKATAVTVSKPSGHVMASRGRSGRSRLVLGSHASRVLVQSQVPVLICK